MIDPTLSAAATASLEAAINKALRYDPATRLKLARLAGKSLVIEIAGSGVALACYFDEQQVRIGPALEHPTTRLSGSLAGLLNLALSEQVNLAHSGVEVWGNTNLLIELKQIIKQLEIDWEEALNDVLGDLLGHPLANAVRAQMGWLKQRSRSGKRLLQEFLTEELRALPSEVELTLFSEQVDQLRLATDRFEARLAKLAARLNANNTP